MARCSLDVQQSVHVMTSGSANSTSGPRPSTGRYANPHREGRPNPHDVTLGPKSSEDDRSRSRAKVTYEEKRERRRRRGHEGVGAAVETDTQATEAGGGGMESMESYTQRRWESHGDRMAEHPQVSPVRRTRGHARVQCQQDDRAPFSSLAVKPVEKHERWCGSLGPPVDDQRPPQLEREASPLRPSARKQESR